MKGIKKEKKITNRSRRRIRRRKEKDHEQEKEGREGLRRIRN